VRLCGVEGALERWGRGRSEPMKPRRNKFLRTRGSGFTKQIVEPVSSFSKQFAQPIIDRREKIKAAGGYIFFQLSRIETESLNIMKNAGLPVDDDCRFESLRRGYAHDSPVGYAATQLTICRTIRSLWLQKASSLRRAGRHSISANSSARKKSNMRRPPTGLRGADGRERDPRS
jgi:hypothetical protein